jgi:hypothetical protein
MDNYKGLGCCSLSLQRGYRTGSIVVTNTVLILIFINGAV